MSDKGGACWSCGNALDAGDYRRGDLCPKCHFETRSCRNCELYDPAINNQCREPAAEPVADKETSNFCEYFRPSGKSKGNPPARKNPSDAKAAFNALFKKK